MEGWTLKSELSEVAWYNILYNNIKSRSARCRIIRSGIRIIELLLLITSSYNGIRLFIGGFYEKMVCCSSSVQTRTTRD